MILLKSRWESEEWRIIYSSQFHEPINTFVSTIPVADTYMLARISFLPDIYSCKCMIYIYIYMCVFCMYWYTNFLKYRIPQLLY